MAVGTHSTQNAFFGPRTLPHPPCAPPPPPPRRGTCRCIHLQTWQAHAQPQCTAACPQQGCAWGAEGPCTPFGQAAWCVVGVCMGVTGGRGVGRRAPKPARGRACGVCAPCPRCPVRRHDPPPTPHSAPSSHVRRPLRSPHTPAERAPQSHCCGQKGKGPADTAARTQTPVTHTKGHAHVTSTSTRTQTRLAGSCCTTIGTWPESEAQCTRMMLRLRLNLPQRGCRRPSMGRGVDGTQPQPQPQAHDNRRLRRASSNQTPSNKAQQAPATSARPQPSAPPQGADRAPSVCTHVRGGAPRGGAPAHHEGPHRAPPPPPAHPQGQPPPLPELVPLGGRQAEEQATTLCLCPAQPRCVPRTGRPRAAPAPAPGCSSLLRPSLLGQAPVRLAPAPLAGHSWRRWAPYETTAVPVLKPACSKLRGGTGGGGQEGRCVTYCLGCGYYFPARLVLQYC